MNRTAVRLAAIAALTFPAAAQAAASPGDVVGLWQTPVNGGLVKIEPCGEGICGHAAGSTKPQKDPNAHDVKNPDASLRGRPLMGLLILKLKPQGADRWGDGWIYNPMDGHTYQASVLLQGAQLKLKGCVMAPLCQTQTWTRVGG